jgi:hypothetical protein
VAGVVEVGVAAGVEEVEVEVAVEEAGVVGEVEVEVHPSDFLMMLN